MSKEQKPVKESVKKSKINVLQLGEAFVFGVFVFAGYIGAAAIEKPDLFINSVKHVVASVLAAFATLVFGYILVKAFTEK